MYTKENITIKNLAGKFMSISNIAFFGNRTIATDSFRLIEVEALGEAHDPVLYPAHLMPTLNSMPKGSFNHEDLGLKEFDGQPFPEVDTVINKQFGEKADMETTVVNAKLLGETLIAMSRSGAEYIEISVSSGDGQAVLAETFFGDRPHMKKQKKVRALVMPINR